MRANHTGTSYFIILLLLFLRLWLSPMAAQSCLRLEPFNVSDAPPLATIDCIYKDSRGFIWLGTYSGLFCYNGYTLTPYYNNPNDSLSIGDNKIKKILEDQLGNMWIGTQVGLNYFDSRKKTFRRYSDKDGIGGFEIYDVKQDSLGNIWIATAGGLYRKERHHQHFIKVFPVDSQQGDIAPVHALELDPSGIYFCSPPGLYYMDLKSGNATRVSAKTPIYNLDKAEKAVMRADSIGNIWIGTALGLFCYNPVLPGRIVTYWPFAGQKF